ncbi:MAG: hemerythrin domain-containing protein, partial [Sedimenticola sp.]
MVIEPADGLDDTGAVSPTEVRNRLQSPAFFTPSLFAARRCRIMNGLTLIKAGRPVALHTALHQFPDEENSQMTLITETLAGDHRRCDEIFAQVEELISLNDWEKGAPGFAEFNEAMEHHFSMEESVLFPSFEARTGQTMGP